jgi:hypothetical protein
MNRLAVMGSIGAIAVGIVLAGGAVASVKPAYCSLPSGPASPAWGFHVNAQITAPSGTYAHGSGTYSGGHATGRICQVDRKPGSPDRQIILSVTHGTAVSQDRIDVGGNLANRLTLPVRVASSTDSRCQVGTKGTVVLTSTYNSVHKDTVVLSFPRACRDHDHDYSGSRVVVLVPK